MEKQIGHPPVRLRPENSPSLRLYKRVQPPNRQLSAGHVTAKYRVKTEGRGRVVDEWKLRPEASDNHWFDGIVGCAVAASIEGAVLPGTQEVAAAKRERIRLSDLKRNPRRPGEPRAMETGQR